MKNIFLVGPMGVGKSSIGKQLAKRLEKTFWDTDKELEARTGVDIPTIFEYEGEQGFRARECTVIDELSRETNIVMATGGGAVLNEQNRQTLKKHGTVVYLSASVDVLAKRTAHDRNRPLLQTEDPHARLEKLMLEREPLYREVADHVVDTSQGSIASIVSQIVSVLEASEP